MVGMTLTFTDGLVEKQHKFNLYCLCELCRPLNCKKKDLCLLKDTFTAVCVSKKELEKSGDIVIPKSRAVQQNRRMRTETSVDTEDDDAFFDSEDDDEDQDESKIVDDGLLKILF
ncbi:testican-1 [Apis cerana cerana]|uniref:Testican-1 n=1 Tax=Apis cerana cerana TaxID=94128 RepID=A0A2A3ED16_APICC|nr:testican-1 [Apis cerana cerana]